MTGIAREISEQTPRHVDETSDFATKAKAVRVWLVRNPFWFVGLVLVVVFATKSQHFLTTFNFGDIAFQAALSGFLAIGLTPVIISGNIDLTVGSVVALSACLAVGLQGYGLVLAILAALAAGGGLGLLNGVLVERLGISSFIVTLGGMIGVRGLAFLYAGDTSLASTDDRFADYIGWSYGPISVTIILFVICAIGIGWMLRYTRHGRNTYAIGGSRTASLEAGVPVSRHVTINFAISGLMAAICGVAMAAYLSAATPSYGTNYELWAVISVVLGGTRLRGGTGGVTGTVIAIAVLAILQNGLNMTNVSPFYIPVIMGGALIVALVIDRRARGRAEE
jgi:ribose transport system permease protein